MTQWCILRMNGRNTIPLTDSLNRHGFEVWTPRETIQRKVPRGKAKQEYVVPVLPTFAFARARDLGDLVRVSMDFKSPHPDFSVFRYFGKYPLIADGALNALRVAERKGTPLSQVKQFSPGDKVKLAEGGFSGMTGIVETTKGQYTLICFPGFSVPIKVSTLHLLADSAMEEAA